MSDGNDDDAAARSLTGRWFGRYDYAGPGAPTAFEAELVEEGGRIDGTMSEPNGFRADMGPTLFAVLTGGRIGDTVTFDKVYDGFDQGDHPRYEGRVDAALSRIEGHWRFARGGDRSGRFLMVRATRTGTRAVRRAGLPMVV